MGELPRGDPALCQDHLRPRFITSKPTGDKPVSFKTSTIAIGSMSNLYVPPIRARNYRPGKDERTHTPTPPPLYQKGGRG